jgi:hypothetical protein
MGFERQGGAQLQSAPLPALKSLEKKIDSSHKWSTLKDVAKWTTFSCQQIILSVYSSHNYRRLGLKIRTTLNLKVISQYAVL